MNLDASTLFVSMIFGSIGVGYFIYGKKQQTMVPMIVGFLLCVYPIFVPNLWASIAVGVALMAAPIFFKN